MAEDNVPIARRIRKPSWRDPRLGVGIILVAGSVALGGWAVQDAAATVQVYAARHTLTPGTALTEDAVVAVEARLPDDAYLLAAEGLPADAVVIRTVGAGELVPGAALGSPADVSLRPVVVPVGEALPTRVGPGVRVDLWLAPEPAGLGVTAGQAPLEPRLVAEDLELSEVREDDSVIGSGSSVELLVPERDVSAVLAARAEAGELVVVPSGGA